MGGMFNEIVAFVARTDVLVAIRSELGHVSGPEVQEGAILSAAAVLGGLAEWVTEPSGQAWLETELPAIDSSLANVVNLSQDQDFHRFGQGVIDTLFDAGQTRVADQVATSSGLARDGVPTLLALSAWITTGHLARVQLQGNQPQDLVATLHAEVEDLRAAGWGPWMDGALGFREPATTNTPASDPGITIDTASGEKATSAPLMRQAESRQAQPTSASRGSRTRRDDKPAEEPSKRRFGTIALVLLLVAGAVISGLALWNSLGDDEQLATRDPAGATTTTIDGAIDDGALAEADEAANTDESTDDAADTQADESADEPAEAEPVVEVPDEASYSLMLTDPNGGSDATGTLELQLDTVSGEVCYNFDVTGLTTPYAAHIHIGPSAGAGGITVDFGLLQDNEIGCLQAHPADLVAAVSRPTVRYVEAHDPSGGFSIRSQLLAPDGPEPEPEPDVEIGDRAHAVVVDGALVLRGMIADQETMETFAGSYSDLADSSIEVVNELELSPQAGAPTDRVVVEDAVLFDVDSTEITTEAEVVLNGMANMLKARPDWSVAVTGHTDSTGPVFHNFSLSLQRASAVQRALIDLGVPELTVTVEGFGPLIPSGDNETTDGRAENRRIEFVMDTAG